MANVDVGTGRVRIDFSSGAEESIVNEISELLESEPCFADGIDFAIESSEEDDYMTILFSAESGWDPDECWPFIDSLMSSNSPLEDSGKAAMLNSQITGCSYDWDANYRSLIIKPKGDTSLSVFEHYGVALSWGEILQSLNCFDLEINGSISNDEIMASITLADKSDASGSLSYLFQISAQASSGSLLACPAGNEFLFVEEMCDELDSIEAMTSQLESGEVDAKSIDDWSYSSEIKDDLLSIQNMYKLVRGAELSNDIIQQAIETDYRLGC